MKWPEDYPFPESVLGRGRDFRSVIALIWYCIRSISIASNRACWFIAMEVGVSSIPVSEVKIFAVHAVAEELTMPVSDSSTARNTPPSARIMRGLRSARTSTPSSRQ